MMRTRALFALAIITSFLGCSTPVGNTAADESPTEQTVDPPGPGFLVQYPDGGDVATAWLEVEGDDYEVLARSEGAYATAGGQLWAWSTREVDHQISDCECIAAQYEKGEGSDEDLEKCRETNTSEVPVLRNASGGDDMPLVEISGLEQTGDISIQATNRGAVGPYWFATTCTYIYACGAAHGSVGCNSVVADLESGERTELSEFMGDEAYAAANEKLRGRAIDELEAGASDSMEVTEPESAQLEAGWPVVTADGLAFNYLFSAPTCYACSDGSWSSYSIATNIQTESLPSRLEGLAELPAPVLAFFETQNIDPKDSAGWTALPEEEERRAELLDQFRSIATQGDSNE